MTKRDIRIVCSPDMEREDWLRLRHVRPRNKLLAEGITYHDPQYTPYEVYAIRGVCLIGHWTFDVNAWADAVHLSSAFTYVARSYRNKAVAWRMWRAGIAYWRPSVIRATAVTVGGWYLLSRVISTVMPQGIDVDVYVDKDDGPNCDMNIYKHAFERLRDAPRASASAPAKLPATKH